MKHKIIKNLVDDIKTNDLIIYCDAGASLNYKAEKRFNEYIEILMILLMEILGWIVNRNLKKFNILRNF